MLKLAGIAGMRPGEIFALTWANLEPAYAVVMQRIYQGEIDTPKSPKSVRKVALGASLMADVRRWRELCVNTNPDAWVFPSESGTPLRTDNTWHYSIGPRLKAAGLDWWINFQVLRRSCSSLLSDKGVEGKVVADQLGHTLDVNQNVYTLVAFDRQEEAVNRLNSLFPPN